MEGAWIELIAIAATRLHELTTRHAGRWIIVTVDGSAAARLRVSAPVGSGALGIRAPSAELRHQLEKLRQRQRGKT